MTETHHSIDSDPPLDGQAVPVAHPRHGYAVDYSLPPLSAPWGVVSGLIGIVIALICSQIIGGIVLIIAAERVFSHPSGLTARGVIDYATTHYPVETGFLGYQFLLLGVAVSVAWIVFSRYRNGWYLLGFRRPTMRVMVTAAVSVLPIIVLAAVLIPVLFNWLLPQIHIQGNERDLFGSPKHFTGGERALVFLLAAVEAPLVEETLFRGLLYQGFRSFFARRVSGQWSIAGAAVISGVLFGLAHFEPHTLPLLIFLGICLGYVFEYSRTIYASMLVHALINAIGVLTFLAAS